MQGGTIARIISDKGFGFIKVDGQEKDLFFHTSDVVGGIESLAEGDKVTFEIADSPKGDGKQNAVKVTKVA